jgi:hypothetical protein
MLAMSRAFEDNSADRQQTDGDHRPTCNLTSDAQLRERSSGHSWQSNWQSNERYWGDGGELAGLKAHFRTAGLNEKDGVDEPNGPLDALHCGHCRRDSRVCGRDDSSPETGTTAVGATQAEAHPTGTIQRRMNGQRRGRPTIRCLTMDLGINLPGLDTDLGQIEHPWLNELRRISPHTPTGQKRILSIANPMVYRLRISNERGATWVDEEREVVWLCAVQRREDGSDNDAFVWFAELHGLGDLLPTGDDELRDDAEAVLRFHKTLTHELLTLVDAALEIPEQELTSDLGEWIPCRVLVRHDDNLQEIWCAFGTRGSDGTFVPENQRDLLFAELERHVHSAMFEARNDWPTGALEWWEVVRFGVR